MDIVRITELQPKTYVEQGDYIAIDNQSDGTKKVQFTNLLDDTLSQENKIAPANVVGNEIATVRDEVEDEIATIRAAVGSPLKASTVAQMTDTNKIYVYVGSETGYTNGNWYYWNGSAWTSGGVYNSVAVVTDPTLTLSGVPADAKATGDEIDTKTSYLSKDTETVDVSTPIDFVHEHCELDGHGHLVEIPSSNYAVSDYIDITNLVGIYRTGSTVRFSLWGYDFYDASLNFISYSPTTTDYEFVEYEGKQVTWLTLNPNAKFVRIQFDTTRTFFTYYTVKIGERVNSYTMPPIIINNESIYEGAVDGKNAKLVVDEITEATHGNNIIEPSSLVATGYYYNFTDGETLIENTDCKIVEDFIPISSNPVFVRQRYDSTSTNVFVLYCYDTNKQYLGYANLRIDAIGDSSRRMSLYSDTAYIRVYVNTNLISGNQICVSETELDEFEEYEIIHIIKDSALSDVDTGKQYLPLYGKVIANFGDSVFGNKRPPNDISTSLANISGATVYNLGFGGCRMAQHSANWDAFSMYQLADAIATNDFSVQNAVDVDSVAGMPQYFKETRALLESIDFSKVDILTIAYGTNDFTAGISLDNPNNAYDTTTFCGALRYSLEKILEAYPQLHVFVCTPTWRFWIGSNLEFLYDSDTHEINGKLLTDFVEAVQDVSKKYHVKSIDNYFDLGIDKFNRLHWFPSNDGTHHNKDGGMLIAQHMANEMF